MRYNPLLHSIFLVLFGLLAFADAIKSVAVGNKNNQLQHLFDNWQSDDLQYLQPVLCVALEQSQVDAADLLLTCRCKFEFTVTKAAL